MGADPILAIKVASTNAARYFRLNIAAQLRSDILADFVIIDNFEDFTVVARFYKKGKLMFK